MQLSTSRWTERIRSWWGLINKVGTRQLACAAVSDGTPVYVAASRDKFTHPLLAERIPLRDGGTQEVWADPTAGVRVCNPYFEKVPWDLVAGVVTDIGVLGPDDVGVACATGGSPWHPELFRVLGC